MLNPADRPVAERYTRALLEAARNAEAVESIRGELKTLVALWEQVPVLGQILRHPRLSPAQKVDGVARALGKPSALLGRLLVLLIEKKRVDALPDILRRYDAAANHALGIIPVLARTATPLTGAQAVALKVQLQKFLGAVDVTFETDPRLWGGLAVQLGDRLWDDSVAGRLARLKDDLLASAKT